MSPARREALLSWASEQGAFIVEDDYDAEYRYDRNPVGSLQGHAPHRVVYVGTTSKTLAPAVRIGWMHPPAELFEPILDTLWGSAGERPPIRLLAFADRLSEASSPATFAAREPSTRPAEGLHVTLALPHQIDASHVTRSLAAHDVLIETLAGYAIDPANARPGLVVGHSRLTEHQTPLIVSLLIAAINQQTTPGVIVGR
jgi:GntR family transcriptional regulator/MocR family aminotransferase